MEPSRGAPIYLLHLGLAPIKGKMTLLAIGFLAIVAYNAY